MTKILVVGNGGREHALAWRLANDSSKPEIFCAHGNAGTARIGINLNIKPTDIAELVNWAKNNRPDLVVVGPEAPLCLGLADAMEQNHIRVFGPSKSAAMLEGSKVFSKEMMERAGVPTAKSRIFDDPRKAKEYIRTLDPPIVIKADGLASGKGVLICSSHDDAKKAVEKCMIQKVFGESGQRILIEEYLSGEEASIIGLVDGEKVVLLSASQDHKRLYNNDKGPNTGGMGAYSPTPFVDDKIMDIVREEVFMRILAELKRQQIIYKGALYAGIMLTSTGPKVLEFNCRFGDPETQALLPRITGDLYPALLACYEGSLDENLVKWNPDWCVCVVMASGNYPDSYTTDNPIEGIEEAEKLPGVVVFHAGTKLKSGNPFTAGGRVLGVTATGADLQSTIRKAYLAIAKISFDQPQYRTDIGLKALRYLEQKDIKTNTTNSTM